MTRRRVLLALLLGLAAGPALGGASRLALPAWLQRLHGDPLAAARLGAAYLAAHPDEAAPGVLLRAIEAALGGPVDPATAGGVDAAALAARLEAVVRADYRRGDAVSVNGWVLSRTEARLYALAAL